MSSEYILLRECNNWEHCKNGSSILGDYLISFRFNVAWWRHQNGNIFRATGIINAWNKRLLNMNLNLLALSAGNSPVTGESPVNSPHKDQWRGALVFSLICAWINGWVNNRETVDLRCHRAHYDVIVMLQSVAYYMLMTINLSFRIITQLDWIYVDYKYRSMSTCSHANARASKLRQATSIRHVSFRQDVDPTCRNSRSPFH